MLPRSRSYDVGASTSPLRFNMERREGRVEASMDSSDEEESVLRRLRYSYARQPSRKISVLSSVNPSPRVSMFEGPNTSMLDAPNEKKKADYIELYKETTTRVVGSVLVIVAIVQLVIIIYLLTKASTFNYCSSSSDYFQPRDFKSPEIFDDLTSDELLGVNNYMLYHTQLNLTSWETAVINSSYIYMIELFLPNKADVLNFIERGLTRPHREAKVIVFRGNLLPPLVEEFIVSPLPHPTSYKLYKDPSFRKDSIPFSSRPNDAVEVSAATPLINSVTEKLYPLLIESYGLCYHNCTKGVNCMKIFDTAPRGLGSGDRRTWVWFFPDIEGFYNYPLGLEILINHESIDTRNWSIDLIVYNGQAFSDVNSLMKAYILGRLKKINYHDHSDNSKTFGHQYEELSQSEQGPGPTYFEPSGKRFRVVGRSVTYNNWQLTLNMRPSTGLQVYNVIFAGSRIAYEISLQELVVFYTGYGPAQGNTNFYDSSLMIGASTMELVRGIDCPHTAVFLDSHFWVNSGTSKRTKNNICIFERNSELPIYRHYTDDYENSYEYFQGTPNYHLVVRTIATIWNYDYIFDYIFYNNGAIEVKVSLTGYVQSTFTLQQEEEYGNIINDVATANLHEHIFNFKIDLDIAGDLNRYTIEDVKLENISHPWFSNTTKRQMKIHKTLVEKELANKTDTFKTSQYHLFHNKNAKNKYGMDRAYRILNKSPVTDLLSGLDVTKAAAWSKYPIIVTRRKDAEIKSSSIYAQNDPWSPILDFDDFLDHENLVDEDLVAWVTMGTYHIPGTEDIPLTSTVWNQYSFFLAPHNYFWRSPDVDQGDTLKMRPRSNTNVGSVTESIQRHQASTCVPQPQSNPSDYDGTRS